MKENPDRKKNAKKTTVFHQIMESLLKQMQNRNSFEDILRNQYEFTNQVTYTNSQDVLNATFGSREYHSSFIGRHETDVERTCQNETIANDSFEKHSSNTESNSRHTTFEVANV